MGGFLLKKWVKMCNSRHIQYIHTNIFDVLTGSDNICSNLTTFDTLRQDMSKVETRNDLRWVS